MTVVGSTTLVTGVQRRNRCAGGRDATLLEVAVGSEVSVVPVCSSGCPEEGFKSADCLKHYRGCTLDTYEGVVFELAKEVAGAFEVVHADLFNEREWHGAIFAHVHVDAFIEQLLTRWRGRPDPPRVADDSEFWAALR